MLGTCQIFPSRTVEGSGPAEGRSRRGLATSDEGRRSPGSPLRRSCETENQINTNCRPVLNPNDLFSPSSSQTHNTLSSSHSSSTASIGLISSSNPKAVFAIPVCLFPLPIRLQMPRVSLL